MAVPSFQYACDWLLNVWVERAVALAVVEAGNCPLARTPRGAAGHLPRG